MSISTPAISSVRRLKGSLSTSHPLGGDEIRALRRWLRKRVNAPCCNSPPVFLSERGPMTRQAFNYICAEIGMRARLSIKVHPHMLRHSCGYALANKGKDTRLLQDYLGHRNITQRSTREQPHFDSKTCGANPQAHLPARVIEACSP
jgi:type 1 fimbriae regulatory protein FimB